MSSNFDSRQTLTVMASVLTAYTSCTALSTATFAASMASQASADTSLTAAEKQIITALTSALASSQPSSNIHSASGLSFPIESKTVFGAMVSILTALTSAQGLTTGNVATQLSSQITVDTGLSSVESTFVTLLTTALASSTPSAAAHAQV